MLVYDPEPCYNQNFNDNYFPQNSPSFSQQYLCCAYCGGPHFDYQCQPINETYYEPNPSYDSSGFDQPQPPQDFVDRQRFLQALDKIQEELEEIKRDRRKKIEDMSIEEMRHEQQLVDYKIKDITNDLGYKRFRGEKIDEEYERDCEIRIRKLKQDFNEWGSEVRKKEQAYNEEQYSAARRRMLCITFDDDDEYSIQTQEYLKKFSSTITPTLSPEEPVDSLIMEDEHLDTISKTESDEFIKSSVENLVQNPSESENVSYSGCDEPDCDDSQTTNFLTYPNPFFDDSTSSDDESSHEEEIHEMSFITYSNPLFDLDEEINSSEFNPIHNEDPDSTPKNDRFDTESYLLESLINRDTFMTFSPNIDFLLEQDFNEWGSKVRKKEQAYNEEQYSAARRRMLSIPFVDEDDYIPLGDIIARYSTSKAITPALSPEEPVDSLIMEDEHLDTIPETESDEFIKSSVENLVQNPSESADLSDGESECDVPINDDSPESHFTTFSNPLFDSNDDFSSDDESLSEEEIQKDEFKYFSNPLYDLDDEIITNEKILPNQKDLDVVIPIPPGIDKHCFNAESDLLESLLNRDSPIDSTKIDSIFDEFSLPRPPEESNSEYSDATIESLSPSPIPVEDSDPFMEEIDIFLASDDSTPPGVESDYDSEGDILLLEELLNDDLVPLAEYNHFTFDVEPDTSVKNDLDELNEDECFDPGGGENVVFLNVEEDDSFTFTIRTFLPFVTYPEVSPLLSSTKNEDTIFDPGIST
ncbi:hypothetical protein Tco_1117408 [Tanacetum coccineum]